MQWKLTQINFDVQKGDRPNGGKKENGEVTPRALILQVSGDLLKQLSAVLQIDIHSVVG